MLLKVNLACCALSRCQYREIGAVYRCNMIMVSKFSYLYLIYVSLIKKKKKEKRLQQIELCVECGWIFLVQDSPLESKFVKFLIIISFAGFFFIKIFWHGESIKAQNNMLIYEIRKSLCLKPGVHVLLNYLWCIPDS